MIAVAYENPSARHETLAYRDELAADITPISTAIKASLVRSQILARRNFRVAVVRIYEPNS
jgi:hypothetical protein